MSTIVTQSGVLQQGVQVMQPNSTTAPTGVQIGLSQVLGNDGNGNVAPVNLLAGTGIDITKSGDNFTFTNTGGGSSGGGTIGIYSPVNLVIESIPADIPIVSEYISDTPTLAQMDTIDTISITPKYSGSTTTGSSITVEAIVGFYCDPSQYIGIQIALFSSADSFTAPVAIDHKQKGSNPNSLTNADGVTLIFNVPSTAGQTVTFAIGAAKDSGLTMTISSADFSFTAEEDVPNTPSVVNTYYLTNEFASSPASIFAGDTAIGAGFSLLNNLQFPFSGVYNNTVYKVCGVVNTVCDLVNVNYSSFLHLGFLTSGTGQPNSSSSYVNTFNSYSNDVFASTPTLGTAIQTSLPVEALFASPNTSSSRGIGVFIQTQQTGSVTIPVGGVKLVVQEILNLANGGIINVDVAPYNTTSQTPYLGTLTPQYSDVTFITQLNQTTRATNSTVKIYGVVSSTPQGVQETAGEVFCFYTSNSPTALPFKTIVMCSAGIGGVYNSCSRAFKFFFTGSPAETPINIYVGVASVTSGSTPQTCAVQLNYEEILIVSSITSDNIEGVAPIVVDTDLGISTVSVTPATATQAGALITTNSVTANSLAQITASGTTGCVLYSADNTVQVTPAEGSISLSSPLKISAGGTTLAPILENNLVVSSIAPTIEWQADYIIGGNSSGVLTNVYDSAGSFTANYTPSSSRLALGEWTRKTATATSPPSANNVATPQWVCCMQPLPVTALKARAIEILVSPYLLGASDPQALSYGKVCLMHYTVSVNMTTAAGVPDFVKGTPFPFAANYGGSQGVPVSPDDPPYIYFDVIPAASSPSAQFTTGNVLVMYAQWILSTTAGVTPAFDISLKALF